MYGARQTSSSSSTRQVGRTRSENEKTRKNNGPRSVRYSQAEAERERERERESE